MSHYFVNIAADSWLEAPSARQYHRGNEVPLGVVANRPDTPIWLSGGVYDSEVCDSEGRGMV
jgi:hypothetical protein